MLVLNCDNLISSCCSDYGLARVLSSLMRIINVIHIIVPIILSFTQGFNFVILPVIYYLYLIGFVVLYGIIAQIVKKIYIRKYGEWL